MLQERTTRSFCDYNFALLSKTAPHPRERIRFLAFSHLKEGKTPRDVADIVRVSRNTIYRWIREFQKSGLAGLKEKPGRGKKPLIPDKDREAFRAAVIELQMKRMLRFGFKTRLDLDSREVFLEFGH